MNAKRLLKLADFLDTLPREKFDFSVVARQDGKPMREALKDGNTRCGTVGCAIGWMPAVFPRDIKWSTEYDSHFPDVVLRRDTHCTDFFAAAAWFDISYDEAGMLFDPWMNKLPHTASPKRVARHIRQWVREQQKAARSAA